MSASVKLTANQLHDLGIFLDRLTSNTKDTGWHLCAYGSTAVSIDGQVLEVNWDKSREQYIVDELVGR